MKTIKPSPIMKGTKPTDAHPAKAKPVEGGVTVPGSVGTTHATKVAIPGVMEGTMPSGPKTPAKPKITPAPRPPKMASTKISAKGAKPATKATKAMFTPVKPRKGY